MKAKHHKRRLMGLITQIRAEVCLLLEHKHIKHPFKELQDVEGDIDTLCEEIEKSELAK